MLDLNLRVPAFLAEHPEWVEAAMAHLAACYPQEGCGIFVATGFKPVVNDHEDPTGNFRMPVDTLILDEVLAIIHSHPDGTACPGASDMQSQIETDLPWAIAVTLAGGCQRPVWFGDQLERPPLIGRPFIHGVFDCYSLIRDWYAIERHVELPDFPRDWSWWQAKQNLYEENFRGAGFEEFDANSIELQIGDVFLAKIRSDVINHGGVYVGDGTVLHHMQHSLSRRSESTLWAPHVAKWVRYRGSPL